MWRRSIQQWMGTMIRNTYCGLGPPMQLKDFRNNGMVIGYKNALHGDSAHRHHRLHNRVDHCVNMAIHHSWSTMKKRVFYGKHSYGGVLRDRPIFLMVWRQSIAHIRHASMAHGMCTVQLVYLLSTSRRHFNRICAQSP
eukprot:1242374-Amphidinium_carterae.2